MNDEVDNNICVHDHPTVKFIIYYNKYIYYNNLMKILIIDNVINYKNKDKLKLTWKRWYLVIDDETDD